MTAEQLLQYCGENSVLVRMLAWAILPGLAIVALHFAVAYGGVHLRVPMMKRQRRKLAGELALERGTGGQLAAEVARLQGVLADAGARESGLKKALAATETELARVSAIRSQTEANLTVKNHMVDQLQLDVAELRHEMRTQHIELPLG